MPVADWVKQMTEEGFGKSTLKVGKTVKHSDGRTVKIVDGQYWGEYGISNFWRWREVKDDGTLGPKECGYGCDAFPKEVES